MRHMLQTSRLNSFLAVALLIAFIIGLRSTAHAQQSEDAYLQQGLQPQAFEIPDLGISLHLPFDSFVITEPVQNRLIWVVRDASDAQSWTLRLTSADPATEAASPSVQVENHLAVLRKNKLPHKVLVNEPKTVGGLQGQICYVHQETGRDREFIQGWLILPRGANSFLVASLLTRPADFKRVRPMIENSLATMKVATVAEISLRQSQQIDAAKGFLDALSTERLRKLVGKKQWLRIYQPAESAKSTGSDDREVGYSVVEVIEAPYGDVFENKSADKYNDEERELGLMVIVQARLADNPAQDIYTDVAGRYWMSWDMSKEAWRNVGTRRQGARSASESEVGIRTRPSTSPPKLTVIRAGVVSDELSWSVPDNYLSQALTWLLGSLLPRDPGASQQLMFYVYHAGGTDGKPKLSQRLETWTPATEFPGHWMLTTRVAGETDHHASTYKPDGTLLRRTRSTGNTVTEPIELKALRDLWRRKGLRTAAR